MRVHVIPHKDKEGIFLVNEQRPCNKPFRHCNLDHMNVFTDDELANHNLVIMSGQADVEVGPVDKTKLKEHPEKIGTDL